MGQTYKWWLCLGKVTCGKDWGGRLETATTPLRLQRSKPVGNMAFEGLPTQQSERERERERESAGGREGGMERASEVDQ